MQANRFYLKYNLQFFAKDGPGGEKTEPATPKKLEDARKEGQVAKSRELVSALSLIAAFITLKVFIGYIGTSMMGLFTNTYGFISTFANPKVDEININTVMYLLQDGVISIIKIAAPIFAVSFAVAVVGEIYQVKWKPTVKPLKPKFGNLSPAKGFKRIFSSQSLINLVKSLVIIAIIIYLSWNTISNNMYVILNIYDYTLMRALLVIGDLIINLGIKISVVYLIYAFVDLLYQKKKFSSEMKMTKQELKDEFKNTEGDPIIKSQIKKKMMQVSQRRMMQSLPEADVIITNPTHFAVALKYDVKIAKAPIVLAKGEDYLAQKIKETAKEYSIEIVENKPLARMLYYNVDVGNEIPQELYQAVAEILAYVYGLKGKK